MFKNLLPKTPVFFDFFEQHAQLICQVSQAFYEWVSSPELTSFSPARNIKAIEHKADAIAHNCIETLHKTFITPFDREDIHRLISTMDDIIDEIEAAASRIALYQLSVMTPEVTLLSQALQKPIHEISEGVHLLRGLKGDEIRARCVKISFYESEIDEILSASVATLFKQTSDALWVIKWKEVYEHLEGASDKCEDVANILEGIVLEND